MTVTEPGAVEVRGVEIGENGWSWVLTPGFTGLGVGAPRGDSSDRVGDGAVGGVDWLGEVEMQGVVLVSGDTAAQASQRSALVRAAWRRVLVGEVPLDLALPGWPEESLRRFGRPLGAEPEPADALDVLQRLTCRFLAKDPLWYGAERDSEPQAGDVTVLEADAGVTPSDRLSIEVVGNGGTPSIENSAGGSLTFTSSLATSSVWTVDVRTGEVTGGGAAASGSPWLRIEPDGDNVFTHSGCASIRLLWRPAYR